MFLIWSSWPVSGANPKHTHRPHCTSNANRAPALRLSCLTMPCSCKLRDRRGMQIYSGLSWPSHVMLDASQRANTRTLSNKPAIAQLVEHLTVDRCSYQMVPGSIRGGRSIISMGYQPGGSYKMNELRIQIHRRTARHRFAIMRRTRSLSFISLPLAVQSPTSQCAVPVRQAGEIRSTYILAMQENTHRGARALDHRFKASRHFELARQAS